MEPRILRTIAPTVPITGFQPTNSPTVAPHLFSKGNYTQVLGINLTVASKQDATSSTLLAQQVKAADGLGDEKFISNQILAEPIRVVSPESIINSAIASLNILGQAIIAPVKSGLDVLAGLSTNPQAVNGPAVVDCLDKLGKKCTTIAESQAANALFANGHDIRAAFNSVIVTGNSIHNVSDTSILNKSPFFQLSTQDTAIQSNNSISFTTDLNYNQFKQDVKFVDGAQISQVGTKLSVATGTADNIAKVNRTVGVESNTSLGATNSIIADQTLVAVSGGTAQVAAYGNLGMQSNGDIAIVASKPSTSGKTAASPAPTFSPPKGGNLYLIADPGVSASMLVMNKSGMLQSTEGDSITTSSKNTISFGSKSNVSASDKFTFVGNKQGGTYTSNGRTFLGKLPFPMFFGDRPSASGIPALPSLPSLPTNKLEHCIPKEFRDKKASASLESNDTYSLTPPPVPRASNSTELPKNSSTLRDALKRQGRLPAPSASADTANGTGLGTTAVNGATANQQGTIVSYISATGILVDSVDKEGSRELLAFQNPLRNTPFNTFFDVLEQEDLISTLAISMVSAEAFFTIEYLEQKLTKIVPTGALAVLLYRNFFTDLLNVPIESIRDFNFSTLALPNSDPNKVQAIKEIVKTYPALKQQIVSMVQEAKTIPAIGFLAGITSMISSVQGMVQPGMNMIKVISSQDLSKIIPLAKPFLSKALKGTPFGALLENPTLLNLGESLLQGNAGDISALLKKAADKFYNDQIKGMLQSQLNSALGDYATLLPAIKEMYNKVALGTPITEKEYIAKFEQILGIAGYGDTLVNAKKLYASASSLLQDLSKGDMLSVLTGAKTADLLSTVLGPSSAGAITSIFDLVKEGLGAYEALAALPDFLSLLNDYRVPALGQLSAVLACTDLFSKLQSLLGRLDGRKGSPKTGSSKGTASFIENAGRLVQAANTILNTPDHTLADWGADTGLDLVALRETYKGSFNLDRCFRVPKLNVLQSAITVTGVGACYINFKLDNPSLLESDISDKPNVGALIQLRVRGFYSTLAREYLKPYQTSFEYNPSSFTFVVGSFDPDTNTGTAYYDQHYSSVTLEDGEGILYKFNAAALGVSLQPDIVDSYLLS